MILCSCHSVSHKDILRLCQSNPELCSKDITEQFKVGSDCGSCIQEVTDLLNDLKISEPSKNLSEIPTSSAKITSTTSN